MGLGFMRRHNNQHPDKGIKGIHGKKDKGRKKGLSIVPTNQPIVHDAEGNVVYYDDITNTLPGDSHTGTTGTVPVPEPGRRHWSIY